MAGTTMSIQELQQFLLWCLGFNYLLLLIWSGLVIFAHDWVYKLHSQAFMLSVESFDAIHYAGLALYKIIIIFFNLVPLLALLLMN
jgi:hypothetical protein